MTNYLHRVAAIARRALPGPLFRVVRSSATALFTPMAFSYDTGHLRSSLLNRAVDRNGNPLPWYTYPAIHFLQNKDFSGRRVLEFGAGQSTLWWAQRAEHVVAMEGDAAWYDTMKRQQPSNVDLYLVPDLSPEANHPALEGQLFDVVVVDGLKREHCVRIAPQLLKSDGAILVDNSAGYGWDRYSSIVEYLREVDFSRVDFYGYAPGVFLPHSTSVLFRNACFLFSGTERPEVPFRSHR